MAPYRDRGPVVLGDVQTQLPPQRSHNLIEDKIKQMTETMKEKGRQMQQEQINGATFAKYMSNLMVLNHRRALGDGGRGCFCFACDSAIISWLISCRHPVTEVAQERSSILLTVIIGSDMC